MTDTTPKKPAPLEAAPKPKYYLTNSQLLPEVIRSKDAGKISNELARMLMMLANRYASRPIFSNYTFRDDMIAEALADLCKNALKFKPERSDNPFAFYTSCIHNSFLGYLNMEKKHRRIRDQLLVEIGENPSYNFQEEYKASMSGAADSREEMSELKVNIEEAKVRREKEIAQEAAAKAEAIAVAAQESLLVFEDAEAVLLAIPAEVIVFIDEPIVSTVETYTHTDAPTTDDA